MCLRERTHAPQPLQGDSSLGRGPSEGGQAQHLNLLASHRSASVEANKSTPVN